MGEMNRKTQRPIRGMSPILTRENPFASVFSYD